MPMKDMTIFRIVRFTFAMALAWAVMSGAGHADTRIFSVQTDRPGVTVTSVQLNGQSLSEAGRSDTTTFFEIDMGSATIPCSNKLAFFASNGQRLEFIVDLCAHNWQVTLPLGVAAAPPPPQPSAPSAPSNALTSLTIYTDDPDIGIEEVNLDRAPMTINSNQANAVTIALPPGAGATCDRDLGLLLTDGRRIARLVDICSSNGAIIVALDGDTITPATPPAGPVPPRVTVAPPPIVAAPTPDNGEFLVIDYLAWEFFNDGGRSSLVYGQANSNQTEFHASCNRGSNQVDISIARTAPGVQPGAPLPITFTAGVFSETFTATGSQPNAISGLSIPELTIPADNPIWTNLIQKDFLVIQTGSASAYALSLSGSGAAARPFLEACKTLQIASPPSSVVPPQPIGQAASDYSCAEENALFSQQTTIESRLIFRNELSQTVQLFWLDFDGRRRPYLSLTPGETGVQPTFFTHPWVVADLSGRCLAIYDARLNDREIVIGR